MKYQFVTMITNNHPNFVAKHSIFNPFWLTMRETGFPSPIGAGDALAKSIYCGMKPVASWDCVEANAIPTGGVFNLEFSPAGDFLVAASEKRSIQIFDPLTHRRIYSVSDAHSDCVNCIKFLDDRMFTTCSDDTTIGLWDIRNLKRKIHSLVGHSNWVKNIEFSVKDKLLVTSGLDGSIYTWDINSYTNNRIKYKRVFNASGLMRCRLSPDATKMVMCTTSGLLVIIHDLDLSKLAEDLQGFKPNLYRLMQTSQQVIPIAAMYDHLFYEERTRNRVEFISDFPEGNDAEVVSALQIHPQGWCSISRNLSHDERSEWTCIHDIQAAPSSRSGAPRDSGRAPRRRPPRRRAAPRTRPYPPPAPPAPAAPPAEPASAPAESAAGAGAGSSAGAAAASSARVGGGVSGIQNDLWEASITYKQHRALQEMANRGQVGRSFNMQRIMGINTGIPPPPPAPPGAPPAALRARASASASARTRARHRGRPRGLWPGALPAPAVVSSSDEEEERALPYVAHNRDRLLHYIEETNEGKNFIKELCFSADGRLVCSPFGRGMRLLAVNESCSELSHTAPQLTAPAPMVELGQSMGIHQDLVVSSKFSPRYHLLVTGCLEGKIVWYKPYSGESLY